MKKRFPMCLSFMIIGALIMGMMTSISGCTVYTKDDLAEYTKQRLKEEYGEDFEIKKVIGGYETIAYPVNDPDLLFETYYVMSNGNGGNGYVQAIIGKQFKELIQEKLIDFEYKYYVDVNINAQLSEAGTDISIEKYDELTTDAWEYATTFYLFLSCDALNQTDEELYELLESIVTIHECFLGVYFLTEEDFNKILEEYSNYASLSSNMCNYLNLTRKYNYIGSSTIEDGIWKIDLETFKEMMEEVRNNELYR